MKTLLLTMLALLFLLGCSSNSSNSPTKPATDANEANEEIQAISGDTDDAAILDIEPDEPLCVTNNYGYVQLTNPFNRPLRCNIGEQISVTVEAGSQATVEVGAGWHELQWCPSGHMQYSEPVGVSRCKTTAMVYDPAHARKAVAMQ